MEDNKKKKNGTKKSNKSNKKTSKVEKLNSSLNVPKTNKNTKNTNKTKSSKNKTNSKTKSNSNLDLYYQTNIKKKKSNKAKKVVPKEKKGIIDLTKDIRDQDFNNISKLDENNLTESEKDQVELKLEETHEIEPIKEPFFDEPTIVEYEEPELKLKKKKDKVEKKEEVVEQEIVEEPKEEIKIEEPKKNILEEELEDDEKRNKADLFKTIDLRDLLRKENKKLKRVRLFHKKGDLYGELKKEFNKNDIEPKKKVKVFVSKSRLARLSKKELNILELKEALILSGLFSIVDLVAMFLYKKQFILPISNKINLNLFLTFLITFVLMLIITFLVDKLLTFISIKRYNKRDIISEKRRLRKEKINNKLNTYKEKLKEKKNNTNNEKETTKNKNDIKKKSK